MSQIQIRDPQGNPIPLMNIRISEGEKPSEEAIYDVFTDREGNTGWPIPFWPQQRYALHVNVANVNPTFLPQSYYLLASDTDTVRIEMAVVQTPPPLTPRLHIEGEQFKTEQGALFQWRGYSMFLAYRRFLAGENLRPDLAVLRDHRINLLRVFGPLPWKETPDYRAERFNLSQLGAFFAFLAAEGFYCEWVPICYEFDRALQQSLVQQSFNIAAQYPNVLIEVANEPHVNDTDPVEILRGLNRHGVLTAYGIYGPYYTSADDPLPTLDYITIHTTRDSAWHRKARHAQELQHKTGKPCISDEPAKGIEDDFNYPGGKRIPHEFVWHHAITALWTPGSTLHTEEGKWGRVPTPGMKQWVILEAVSNEVWGKIDPSWQAGSYAGSHFSSSPVDHIPDIWTYSSMHPNRALSVRCAVSEPTAQNGWILVETWGAGNSIVRLVR